MRRLALLFCLTAPSVFAQTPCAGGTVFADDLTFECSGVDLEARVSAQVLTGQTSPDCFGCLIDVWGWTDEAEGREYALVGTYRGVAFVDVTEATAPRPLGYMPGSGRDVKVWGHHAYAGEHDDRGVQIFDLHRLRGLTASPNRQLPPDAETEPMSIHNLVAAEGTPLVAAVSDNGGCPGGLALFDVAVPDAPVLAGCVAGPTHDAQCLVYDGPDADHLGRTVCFTFDANRVGVLDATEPGATTWISEAFYPDPGYTHQGWLTEDRRHLLVGDEGDEYGGASTRTLVLDVSDLDAPDFVGAYLNPTTTATDHNLYVAGGYVYQANYVSGLRVLSLAGVATAELEEVAFFDTYPAEAGEADGFNGAWSTYPFFESGTVLVSDQRYGLFVLRPDPSVVTVGGEVRPEPAGLALAAETPARGAATVTLTAPRGEAVTLSLYDLRGRALGVLFEGAGSGAPQRFEVDAPVAGVVLVRAQTAAGAVTKRVAFVR